ncbi:MAG: amidohydrolase family protein [Phycisphaerales bacterium]|jgi:imidazolonepropionase-like amidohydrolase
MMRRRLDSGTLGTLAICVGASLATSASAQSPTPPAPPQSAPILIHGATIHTASADESVPAVIDGGWLLVRDGRIAAIGAADRMPESDPAWETIDATGMHVCPGFHTMDTQLGLIETMQVRATDDRRETGDVTPEVVPAVAINPDSDLIPVARSGGVLLASVVPTGGLIPGWCSTVRLDGWTPEDLAIEDRAGLVVNWPMMTPVRASWMRRSEREQQDRLEQRLEALEEVFESAKAWAASGEDRASDRRRAEIARTLDGGRPLLVSCGSAAQIEAAIAFAARHGLKIAIVGGPGALECADLLASRGVAVVVDGVHRLPRRRHDRPAEPFELAGRLHAAGVSVAIAASEEPAHERNLPHQAAAAAAHGLPPDAALAAVTRVPAEVVGIADRYGSLVPGRSATLLVLDGPPLEVATTPIAAFVDGRRLDLSNRHTRQRDKYLEKYRRLGLIEQ